MNRLTLVLGAASALLLSASMVSANTSSVNMAVSATVEGNCSIEVDALNFGSYDPLGGDVAATSEIRVTCNDNLAYNVEIGDGNTGSAAASRLMEHATNETDLEYNLYTDSGHTTVWDESATASIGTGNGSAQAIPVYGLIPGGQTGVEAGAHNDVVAVTVRY